jgi:hypothetical protein
VKPIQTSNSNINNDSKLAQNFGWISISEVSEIKNFPEVDFRVTKIIAA